MNTPVRNIHDNEPMNDGLLNFAIKPTRPPEHSHSPVKEAPRVSSPPSRDELTASEPPWKQNKQPGLFAGEVAVVGLGGRRSLAPDRIPDLQLPNSNGRPIHVVQGMMAIIALVIVFIGGYMWGSTRLVTPPAQRPALGPDRTDWQSEVRRPVANIDASSPESSRVVARPDADGPTLGAAMDAARSVASESTFAAKQRAGTEQFSDRGSPVSAAVEPLQFTVSAARLWESDQPAQLTISVADAGMDAVVAISGLAPGSVLSAGTPMMPDAWLLSAAEFNDASVIPPRGFVGVMSLVVEFRLANNAAVDRQYLQLEWSPNGSVAPPKPAALGGDADDNASMMKKGADSVARRDIAAARLFFQHAAQLGDAAAAFALAETYDPFALKKLGSRQEGFSDIAQAQSWYEKARDLGSAAAPERIMSLTQDSK